MNQNDEDMLVNNLGIVLPTVDKDTIRKVIKEQASATQNMQLEDFTGYMIQLVTKLKEQSNGPTGGNT